MQDTELAVLEFRVEAWAAWVAEPGEDRRPPSPQRVPALLRRRLSAPARAALHVAEVCLGDRTTSVATVFASRHGELARTLELLEQISDEQPMSPTAFSLSVHNAAAGAYSIARGSRAASTTLASGRATLAHGLLEAVVQSAATEQPVLMVYVGGPPPGPYAEFAAPEEHSCALALLVDAGSTTPDHVLRPAQDASGYDAEPALAAARVLRGEAPRAMLAPAPAGWCLERIGG